MKFDKKIKSLLNEGKEFYVIREPKTDRVIKTFKGNSKPKFFAVIVKFDKDQIKKEYDDSIKHYKNMIELYPDEAKKYEQSLIDVEEKYNRKLKNIKNYYYYSTHGKRDAAEKSAKQAKKFNYDDVIVVPITKEVL
jgi:hypothetical protein